MTSISGFIDAHPGKFPMDMGSRKQLLGIEVNIVLRNFDAGDAGFSHQVRNADVKVTQQTFDRKLQH